METNENKATNMADNNINTQPIPLALEEKKPTGKKPILWVVLGVISFIVGWNLAGQAFSSTYSGDSLGIIKMIQLYGGIALGGFGGIIFLIGLIGLAKSTFK